VLCIYSNHFDYMSTEESLKQGRNPSWLLFSPSITSPEYWRNSSMLTICIKKTYDSKHPIVDFLSSLLFSHIVLQSLRPYSKTFCSIKPFISITEKSPTIGPYKSQYESLNYYSKFLICFHQLGQNLLPFISDLIETEVECSEYL